MADNKFVTLEALKSTAARLQQEWLKSISKAGHARFEVAEAIPDASAAFEPAVAYGNAAVLKVTLG